MRIDALESARPVFIVGMLRSGTTLAEQILASHPAVFGAGELHMQRNPIDTCLSIYFQHAQLPEILGAAAPANGRGFRAYDYRAAISRARERNKFSTAISFTLSVNAIRKRAVPTGTVGGRIARTSYPCARSFAARSAAA